MWIDHLPGGAFCRYIESSNFREALTLITALLQELKRLDDKMILTEVHLLESRVNFSLANLPKSKVRFDILSPFLTDR